MGIFFKENRFFSWVLPRTYTLPLLIYFIFLAASPSMAGDPLKGLMLKHNDTVWLAIGGGLRLQTASRNSNTDDSSEFSINSMRLYISGQLHKHLKFNINTEKYEGDSMMTIDALLKFELNPSANLWVGRTLVPSDRPGLNGPYSSLSWNQYRQPLFSAYHVGAGQLGRSEGAVFWGTRERFQYLLGAFDGLEDDYGNDSDHLLYAARLAYNFLNVEPQPSHYYTSATHHGAQGNILTTAVTLQSQSDGTGSTSESGDFFGYAFDVFSERILPNQGVFNFGAGYKEMDADLNTILRPADATVECFCIFDGDTFYTTAGYLFPNKVGPGKLQPYFRHTENNPSGAKSSATTEWGTNYIIFGNKTSLNLNYARGDANASGYAGNKTDTVTLGLQLQFY